MAVVKESKIFSPVFHFSPRKSIAKLKRIKMWFREEIETSNRREKKKPALGV